MANEKLETTGYRVWAADILIRRAETRKQLSNFERSKKQRAWMTDSARRVHELALHLLSNGYSMSENEWDQVLEQIYLENGE